MIGQLKAQKREAEAAEQQELVRAAKLQIAEQETVVAKLDEERAAWLFKAPNLPDDSVPAGNETNNQVVRSVGELPQFDFQPKAHWDIAESLGLIDFARGVKLSGSGFVLYRGLGAQLERALIQFMIDLHVEKHGYTEWSTPFFLNRESMTGSAHIVKFTPEMYHDSEGDLFALPTAEPALVNIHRGEILSFDQLPLNYVAYSPCWRREAGAAGKDTRGLLRVHQFDKVEMVKYTAPEESYNELENMLANATDVITALGLTYRIVLLAAGDISFSAAKCYDIEIYAPGADKWLEVSSVSNCEDFQSRRASIRFRREQGAKPEFVHLLNGSGTALPRLYATLLETYQNEDGSVTVPPVLRPYLKNIERITV
jgi:seryl-tRNA synthetase